MRGQTIAQACAAVLLSLVLVGCGGGGPDISLLPSSSSGSSSSSSSSSSSGVSSSSGSSSGVTTIEAAHVIMATSSPTLASGSGVASAATVTITVTVTDINNVTIPNYPVGFGADGGALSITSGLTDANGNATATLTAGSATPGTIITVRAEANSIPASVTVKVASATSAYVLGTLSATGTFASGVIAVGQSPLSAGGSAGLQVSLVDINNSNTPFNGSAAVSFSSPCQSKGLAQITSPVSSTTGTFSSTYHATGCSGSDTITATVALNGSSITASGSINVLPATLGFLEFDATNTGKDAACNAAATSCTIGLKGTGLNESAQIYFKVLDSNGNPVPGQTVTFGQSTTAGGLSVSPTSAISDPTGEVVTTVSSGTVHTSVRVTASIASVNLHTQSSILTVSTGFPTQGGFSLSSTVHNLIGDDFDGNTATLTAILSDRYGNPVPDGTAITFTSECGQVQPSCNTVGGTCNVQFKTANPRTKNNAIAPPNPAPSQLSLPEAVYQGNNCAASPNGGNQDIGCDDHRCTVLAYAIGEETFVDCNGTGQYVSKDNSSNNPSQCPSGDAFVALPEAWRDDNENVTLDKSIETYLDFNNNGVWDDPVSSLFVGLLCNDPDCYTKQNSLHVYQSQVMIMTSNTLKVDVYPITSTTVLPVIVPSHYVTPDLASFPLNSPIPSLEFGCSQSVDVFVGDTQWQVPPDGTTISISFASGGTVVGPSSDEVLDTQAFGYHVTTFTYKAPALPSPPPTKPVADQLLIKTVTPAPGNTTTTYSFPITYSTNGVCP